MNKDVRYQVAIELQVGASGSDAWADYYEYEDNTAEVVLSYPADDATEHERVIRRVRYHALDMLSNDDERENAVETALDCAMSVFGWVDCIEVYEF